MSVERVVDAWSLIGHEGVFRLPGGHAIYEAVDHNDALSRTGRVRLARLDVHETGLRQVNRWVDADQPIEVLRDFEDERFQCDGCGGPCPEYVSWDDDTGLGFCADCTNGRAALVAGVQARIDADVRLGKES